MKERQHVEELWNMHDKSSWAVGGGVMLGLGVGFFFLPHSIFAFVGCILGGIGLGLMVAALASARRG